MSRAIHDHPTTANHLDVYSVDSHADEMKASYDDLIDQYGSDYAHNAGHQTVAIPSTTMSPTTTTANSPYPFAHQPSYSSGRTAFSASNEGAGGSKSVDWGYPPPLPTDAKGKEKSFWQRWMPDSMACRLFLVTVLLETTFDLAVEGELLLRLSQRDKQDTNDIQQQVKDRRLPVYLSIFALAHIFQFVLALDAVWARNTLQFLFLIGFNACFLGYGLVQRAEIMNEGGIRSDGVAISVTALINVIPVAIALAEIAYVALGWRIYNEFGWKIYKFIGADRRMKKMYANYQVYQCLVKFDLFFFVAFSIQFIGLVLNLSAQDSVEYIVSIIALPFSVLLLVEGFLAARHENKWMMATFMSGCTGAMIYFVYKLYSVLNKKDKPEFDPIWKSLTIFSIFSILLLVATFTMGCLVMSSFGRGLKEQLAKNNRSEGGHGRMASHGTVAPGRTAGGHPHRMSIE